MISRIPIKLATIALCFLAQLGWPAERFHNLASVRGDSGFYACPVRITVNEALMKIRRNRFNEVSIPESIEVDDALVSHEIEARDLNPE
jgi:hypothetical protein